MRVRTAHLPTTVGTGETARTFVRLMSFILHIRPCWRRYDGMTAQPALATPFSKRSGASRAGRDVQIGASQLAEKDLQPAWSRQPTGSDEGRLAARQHRLNAMRASVETATAAMAELASHRPALTAITIRQDFVRLATWASGEASDRRALPRHERPPATRLLSANGAALRLILTALFEAHTAAGARAGTHPTNARPLLGTGPNDIGWVDLIASPAQPATAGRSHMSTTAKRLRQLKEAIKTLHAGHLVDLPRQGAGGNKYERFELLHEGGQRRYGDPVPYLLPKTNEQDTLALPLTVFTCGWIHVLEDTELAVLLMRCSLGAPTEVAEISAGERAMRYGMSRDAFDSYRVLERVGILEVIRDPDRSPDGTIRAYSSGRHLAPPHQFRLLTDAFDASAFPLVHLAITGQPAVTA